MAIDPPYDRDLKGILAFRTFEDAECTLLRLEELRQKYIARGDDKGSQWCREVALTGRLRAERISRDRRVNDSKRRQKREISFWFQVWLETPEIFGDWLTLRKQAPSFRKLAGSEDCAGAGEGDRQNGKER